MKNTEGIINLQDSLNKKMKDKEEAILREYINKLEESGSIETGNIESYPSNLFMTSMEHHYLIGSSMEGGGFHPNVPIIIYAGFSLEEINSVRLKMQKLELAENPDGFSTIEEMIKPEEKGGVYRWAKINVRSLITFTEEMINSEEPMLTFSINSVSVRKTGEKEGIILVGREAEDFVIKEMKKRQVLFRHNLK